MLDAGALNDVDYSAGVALSGLADFLEAHHVTFVLTRADSGLLSTLKHYGLLDRIAPEHLYPNLVDAVLAFEALPAPPPQPAAPAT